MLSRSQDSTTVSSTAFWIWPKLAAGNTLEATAKTTRAAPEPFYGRRSHFSAALTPPSLDGADLKQSPQHSLQGLTQRALPATRWAATVGALSSASPPRRTRYFRSPSPSLRKPGGYSTRPRFFGRSLPRRRRAPVRLRRRRRRRHACTRHEDLSHALHFDGDKETARS